MYDQGGLDGMGIDEPERVELDADERVTVRQSLSRVRKRTESLLPKLYLVEVDTYVTPTEQQYGVMVTPPGGRRVRADLDVASFEDSGEEGKIGEFELSDEDCSAIATQLAASAVMQFADSDGAIDDVTPAS